VGRRGRVRRRGEGKRGLRGPGEEGFRIVESFGVCVFCWERVEGGKCGERRGRGVGRGRGGRVGVFRVRWGKEGGSVLWVELCVFFFLGGGAGGVGWVWGLGARGRTGVGGVVRGEALEGLWRRVLGVFFFWEAGEVQPLPTPPPKPPPPPPPHTNTPTPPPVGA